MCTVRPAEPPCYVYIIQCVGGHLYTGITDNIPRRVKEHAAGGSRFTQGNPFEKLLFTEKHPSRSAAAKRERQIKGWTRAKKLALATGDFALLKRL